MRALSSPAARAQVLQLQSGEIEDFCTRWRIQELSLFGSILRDDFREDSDVDVLVDFLPGVRHGLIAVIQMEDELSTVFGRKVDLLTRKGIALSLSSAASQSIQSAAEVVYAR